MFIFPHYSFFVGVAVSILALELLFFKIKNFHLPYLPYDLLVDEVSQLAENGFKEIVLLGQNVNSYNDSAWNPAVEPLPVRYFYDYYYYKVCICVCICACNVRCCMGAS